MSSFDGTAETYAEARHGYPVELRQHLRSLGLLRDRARVLDLGAGTGQLTLALADAAGSVVAAEPEPDMARVGREATERAGKGNVRWIEASDRELASLFGTVAVFDLVVLGNSFHHMDRQRLLVDLDTLVSEAGAVVSCSSSVPVWLQHTEWSRALRRALRELGFDAGESGVPDHRADEMAFAASAFARVDVWTHERTVSRTGESILGELVSSASARIDADAETHLRATLERFLDGGRLLEHVHTTAVIGRRE